MRRLEGKVALITGATSGIGAACAEAMAAEGAKVIIVGRTEEKGKQVEDKIRRAGGEAIFMACDVTIEEEIITLKKKCVDQYGKLDILMNNAGVLLTGTVEEIDEKDWQQTFDTNMKSCFLMTKHFMSLLKDVKGVVLNNASANGLQSCIQGRSYMYSSSKAAVIQFTKLCALNYAGQIRVNCICPGVIDTPIFTNRDFTRWDGMIPMDRIGTAGEVAKAAVFLVSDDAAYITGVALPVDGGMSI